MPKNNPGDVLNMTAHEIRHELACVVRMPRTLERDQEREDLNEALRPYLEAEGRERERAQHQDLPTPSS